MIKKFPLKILVVTLIFYLLISMIYRDKLPNIKESIFFIQNQIKNGCQFITDIVVATKVVATNQKIIQKEINLEKQLATLAQLQKAFDYQNKKLLKALHFQTNNKYRLIPTKIIGRSPDSWYNFVIINKGSADGIKKFSPVLNEQGLVGEVTQVYLNHAQVTLVTDRNIRIGCELANSQEVGVCAGMGFNNLEIRYIPANSPVKVGDLIITSGYSSKFPAGVSLAKITAVTATDITQKISAQPVVNLACLDILFVLKD